MMYDKSCSPAKVTWRKRGKDYIPQGNNSLQIVDTRMRLSLPSPSILTRTCFKDDYETAGNGLRNAKKCYSTF